MPGGRTTLQGLPEVVEAADGLPVLLTTAWPAAPTSSGRSRS